MLTAVTLRTPWAITYPLLFPIWKVKSSRGNFFFCLLVLISITLFITLFFFSQRFPCLISLIVVYWAKHFHRWSPRARTQPHCPRSNYSKKERTFLLVCEGTFPWLPSSPGVESSSAQLLLLSEPARERNLPCWDPVSPSALPAQNFWPTSNTKTPTTYFLPATYSLWLNMWQVIFPRSLLERHQHRLFNNILFTTHYKSITSTFITLECKDAISNKLSQRHTLINKRKPIMIIIIITTVCMARYKTKYSTKFFVFKHPNKWIHTRLIFFVCHAILLRFLCHCADSQYYEWVFLLWKDIWQWIIWQWQHRNTKSGRLRTLPRGTPPFRVSVTDLEHVRCQVDL